MVNATPRHLYSAGKRPVTHCTGWAPGPIRTGTEKSPPPHRDSILRKYIFHNAITCRFEVGDNEFLWVIRVLKMAGSFRFALKPFVSLRVRGRRKCGKRRGRRKRTWWRPWDRSGDRLPYYCHEPRSPSSEVVSDMSAGSPASLYSYTIKFCFLLCWLSNGAVSYSDRLTWVRLFAIRKETAVSKSRPCICLHAVRNPTLWLRMICILAQVRTGLLPDARRIFNLLRQLVPSTESLSHWHDSVIASKQPSVWNVWRKELVPDCGHGRGGKI